MNRRLFTVWVFASLCMLTVGYQGFLTSLYVDNLAAQTAASIVKNPRVLGEVTTSGLVVYLPFENQSAPFEGGFLVSDEYKPTTNTASQAEGKIGKAASFDGNGTQKIIFKKPVQDDFTICAWIKTDAEGTDAEHYQSTAIVTSESRGIGQDFGMGVDAWGRFVFGVGGASPDINIDKSIRSTSQVSNDAWQHFCAERAKSTGLLSLFINGALQATRTATTLALSSNPNITLGDKDDSPRNPYYGELDELRIYNRALSGQEVSDIYAFAGAPATSPNQPVVTTPTTPPATSTPTTTTQPPAQASGPTSTPTTTTNDTVIYTRQLVNNRSLKISVTAASYQNNFWNYRVEWQRTLDRSGSLYVNGAAILANAPKEGSAYSGYVISPKSRVKVEFYSEPNGKGVLLARKYYTALDQSAATTTPISTDPPVSTPPTSSPPQFVCPSAATNAFTACYYAGMNFETLKATSTVNSINFDWAGGSPSSLVPADKFSATYEGKFNFEAADYIFAATADDGVRVYVDGQAIIDKWINQSATTYSYTKTLTAGTHTVKMEYFENAVDAVAKLSWMKKEAVISPPISTPTPNPTPTSTTSSTIPTYGSTVPAIVNPMPSSNGVTIKSGAAQSEQRTFSISRVFAKGEITNYPQARVNGSATLTQADVMSRYEDGSVKHVIISFVATLPGNGSLNVDFVNQSNCNCGTAQALTKDQMLAAGYNFDAQIETSKDGSTQSASARTMLQNGDFRYWLKGSIVTQIILEDRSTALKYDFGYKNKTSFLATPNGYFRAGDTTMNVLDASDIPVPSVVNLFGERIRICGKTGNTLKIGVSSCPNADGRKYGGTPELSVAAWGALGTVEGVSGWRAADTSLFKAMHPIFVATFTPKTPNSTKVEMILENMWTQKLQNQKYDLTLKLGAGLTPVYSKANITQLARTRWRKTFYIGQTPGTSYIDYNLPYLVYSKAIPNFNTNLNITDGAINAMLDTGYSHSEGHTPGWRNSDKGDIGYNPTLGVQGQIWKNQPAAGQRPDIGLFTTWQMVYLYSMKSQDSRNPELFSELMGNVEAANQVPLQARELKTGKAYVSGMSDDMFGRSISLDARPKTYGNTSKSADQDGDYMFAVDDDQTPGWTPDVTHEPNYYYIPYLLSGDWYILESLYNVAGYDLMVPNPNTRLNNKGLFAHEDRGVAWAFRSIAETASIAPDGTPEKKYFTDKLMNNLAVREGSFNVTNGYFYQPCSTNPFNKMAETSIWCIGKNAFNKFPNPLNFLSGGYGADGEADTSKASRVSIPFQNAFLHVVFGHIEELGYPQIGPMRERFAQNLLGQVFDPSYSPYYTQDYRTPSMDLSGNYFQTWAQVKDAMQLQYQLRTSGFVNDGDYEGGYSVLSYGASSFLTKFSYNGRSGLDAWEWYRTHIGYQDRFNGSPKWAFLPRP